MLSPSPYSVRILTSNRLYLGLCKPKVEEIESPSLEEKTSDGNMGSKVKGVNGTYGSEEVQEIANLRGMLLLRRTI